MKPGSGPHTTSCGRDTSARTKLECGDGALEAPQTGRPHSSSQFVTASESTVLEGEEVTDKEGGLSIISHETHQVKLLQVGGGGQRQGSDHPPAPPPPPPSAAIPSSASSITVPSNSPKTPCTIPELQLLLDKNRPWASVLVVALRHMESSQILRPPPALTAYGYEPSTLYISQAFQAVFRVSDPDAADAFLDRLLALHQGAQAFFAQQVHAVLNHTSRSPAGAAAPVTKQSMQLGGPYGMSMSAQPLVIITSNEQHRSPKLMPALLIELDFRDAATPLMHSSVRADRCIHEVGEMAHMFTADGRTVLYQSPASELYMGYRFPDLETYLGLSSYGMQQQQRQGGPSADDHGQGREATAAAAAIHSSDTSWLQKLFALDMRSLKQMMTTTSEGGVWR